MQLIRLQNRGNASVGAIELLAPFFLRLSYKDISKKFASGIPSASRVNEHDARN